MGDSRAIHITGNIMFIVVQASLITVHVTHVKAQKYI